MTHMFKGATSFNRNINNWNTSSLTTTRGMFQATPFNQDLSSWDVSQVTNMGAMFDDSDLSTDNYDLILIGWASQNLQQDVSLGVGSTMYCSGATARNTLVNTY